MGGIVDAVAGVLGFGNPKASSSAASTVDASASKDAAIRSKLLETAGGQSGEELLSGSTKKRDTLLGN